jgi:hypothetical protein
MSDFGVAELTTAESCVEQSADFYMSTIVSVHTKRASNDLSGSKRKSATETVKTDIATTSWSESRLDRRITNAQM